MMRNLFKIYFLLLFITMGGAVIAQRSEVSGPGKVIDIRHTDRYNYQDKDTSGKFVSLAGHAFVQQARIKFYADSIVLNQRDNIMEAFGNVHINDADSVNIYSQYLKYLSLEKKAYLKQNVKLTDGKGVLTTNELEYDTQLKIGKYFNGGKVVNRKTTITSIEGSYYGDTRDVYFRKNVLLISPDYRIITDTLLYNFNSEIVTFVSPSTIYNAKRTITVRDGYYDLKRKKATFYQRPFVDDSTYTFTADEVAYDDSTGLGEAQGSAVYRSKDSVGGYDIIANNIKTNKKRESFLATQGPILFLKQEKDTIFISADTLYSAKLSDLRKSRIIPMVRDRDTSHVKRLLTLKPAASKDSSKNRFFEAYYHVKIFSDSLQALGDSLFYSLEDSTFRLLKNPVTWAQENQITGDTIYMYLQNRKPERIYVFENAMAISKESKDYFNQVRGNNMNALFKGGKINFIKTKGSPAENVYYAVDDNLKFVGVNKSSSDVINVYFTEGKPQKVVFVNNLEGTLYPMQQVNHEEIKVRKFQWLDDKRPKSKFDIFSN